MKRHAVALGVLAGPISVVFLGGGIGIAHGDPEPGEPGSPLIDQILTETPDLFADPRDEGSPTNAWGGAGMYCQNMFVRCR
ncbi:hypothetical protein [Mycobacterium sp. 050134]|uniref:hypothetical protein n=1 Tax=Mycobacterium sp. 050134 TaxID=3096111 RepID=UPI002ED794DB